jgi:hypothetical protein
MSTWDDKPNSYAHAIEQMMALKDEVLQAKAESSAKRVVIVRLLNALSEIENTPDCPPAIVDIIHKAIVVT